MFRSYARPKYLYFVGKVFDDMTGKVSTRVNGWQYLGGCLFESVLTIWRSSLLEDARAILSVKDLHLAECTSFETLCFVCL